MPELETIIATAYALGKGGVVGWRLEVRGLMLWFEVYDVVDASLSLGLGFEYCCNSHAYSHFVRFYLIQLVDDAAFCTFKLDQGVDDWFLQTGSVDVNVGYGEGVHFPFRSNVYPLGQFSEASFTVELWWDEGFPTMWAFGTENAPVGG